MKYHYFHVQFEDNPDIYIVRVVRNMTLRAAEKTAIRIITSIIMNIGDFKTQIVVIPNSLLLQFVFIEDIAQLEAITHP